MGAGVGVPVSYGQVCPDHGRKAVEDGRLPKAEGLDIVGGRLGVGLHLGVPAYLGT